MAGSVRFGTLPDGGAVEEVVIAAGDLSARVITFGAVIRDLRLKGVDHPLVLGFETLDDYLADSGHVGAVAGRFANRIADGRLVIDGRRFDLPRNENGRTHLHGGGSGFGRRNWRLLAHDGTSVTLALASPDGDAGYPGRVEATCRYAIEAPATLRYTAEATTDAPTVVNLVQHAYFNLDDSPDILDHEVRIDADRFTPFNGDKIPTGEMRSVAGTDHDFRSPRPIRHMKDGRRFEYDMNFVVATEKAATPRPQARLRGPKTGVTLDIASTEPAIQFYDGCMMNVGRPGLGGRRYRVNAGCCFEPQFFPDSPNHANFPSAVLRPGETYRQVTTYGLSRT